MTLALWKSPIVFQTKRVIWRKLAQKLSLKQACGISSTTKQHAAKRMVYRSLSNNIYENLALEEWIYERTDLSMTDVLLVWQSNPCVVIGKHQNPWMEANVLTLEKEGVDLARRSSGGGTVYHDNGNLNLSFLKDRSRYNRRENLELVVNAVRSKWDLDLAINDRDDIILDGQHKISGTAAKLTRNKSYHHFTLLHSVDTSRLSACLDSTFKGQHDLQTKGPGVSIQSRSTPSVRAPVQNLQSRAPSMTFDLLVHAVVDKFLEAESRIPKNLTYYVNPLDEILFPGVSEIRDRLDSWNWVFGKTPKFSLQIEEFFRSRQSFIESISITVEKGCLASFTVKSHEGQCEDLAELFNVKGVKMKREELKSILFLELDNFLTEKLMNVFGDLVDASRMVEDIQECVDRFILCNFL